MDDGQLQWAHRQRRPRGNSVPLGVLLGGVADSKWFKSQQRLGQFVELLETLLGGELAGRVSLEGFGRNVLHLSADSSAHCYELQLRKEAMLSAMNRQLSGVYVRDIRLSLRQGPVSGEGDRPRPGPSSEPSEPAP